MAVDIMDKNSANNLYILRGHRNTICIDCNDKDWIFPLVVICQEKVADEIKAVMLKWDNFIREEYGQKLREDIHNVYGKEDTLLNSIEGFYGRTIT